MTRGVLVVAVDGPVAAGKSALARRLARRLGLRHLASGTIYRAAAARLLESGGDPADGTRAAAAARDLTAADLERDDLRDQRIGLAASELAAHPAARAALLAFQRAWAAAPPGAVIDGRDIGAVVCPDADAKLFVTAALEVRARRRRDELAARGEAADLAAVRAEIAERDRRDMEREASPLRRADDAVPLDTTALNADEAFRAALEIVRERCGRAAPRRGAGRDDSGTGFPSGEPRVPAGERG